MKETDTYRKVFIKTEADLPKEKGMYDTNIGSTEFDPNGLILRPFQSESVEFWMKCIEFYYQPEPEGEKSKEYDVIDSILYHIKLNVEMNMQSAIEHLEVEDSSYYEGVENECKQVIDLINKINIADFTNSSAEQVTDQPKETAESKGKILTDFASKISTKSLYDDPELTKASHDALNEMQSDLRKKTADQPQPTKRTAEEVLLKHFPVARDILSEAGITWIIDAMEEYRREGVPTSVIDRHEPMITDEEIQVKFNILTNHILPNTNMPVLTRSQAMELCKWAINKLK